jgi:NAD(P)-dependent dehydrogenase (short-subunit alcohol dehydrogenase family)
VARVFITGSSDGLGLMAARLLIEQGHEVVRMRARASASATRDVSVGSRVSCHRSQRTSISALLAIDFKVI